MKTLFEKKKNKTKKRTRKVFKNFYIIYNKGLEIILELKNELISEFEKDKDKNFNKACLLLLSRYVQHLESIITLTEASLYGDATALVRNILGDINMLYYLHFKPKLLTLFLQESEKEYQTNPEFKKNFSENQIEKYLIEKGLLSIKDSFEKLSKGNHASSWGCQFYGIRGKDKNKYSLKYEPRYETYKPLYIFPMIVSAHYDFIKIVFQHRKDHADTENERLKRIEIKTEELLPLIAKFIDVYNKALKTFNNINF
jgi:hypothetical protein